MTSDADPTDRPPSGPRAAGVDLETWRAFLRAHALVTRRLDAELRAHGGMPLDVYDVLVTLADAPGQRLRMQQLADAVLITKSSCTRLVDRMARDGLVERRRSAEDGRGVVAALTPQGLRALRRAATVHLRGVRRYFVEAVAPGDRATVRATLQRMVDAVDGGPPAR